MWLELINGGEIPTCSLLILTFGSRFGFGLESGLELRIVVGKEVYVLFKDALNTFFLMVIWHRTYSKGLFREQESKPAAATWATLSD